MTQFKKSFEKFEWLDLEKPAPKELENMVKPFHIDHNLLDDALEHGHLPKLEKHKDFTFFIFRAFSAAPQHNYTTVAKLSNKIAFLLSDSHLITVHQKPFDFLEDIKGRNFENPEALMLSIVYEMILTFEPPINWLSDKMDDSEKEIFLKKHGKISIDQLYYQKAKARICRKLLQFSQNVLNQVDVKQDNLSNLQDIRESVVNYMLQLDEVIEDAQSILNTHISLTAQKNNDVMKLLTVFSAFFLPLTFIVGVYGMNFTYMPELEWRWGYYATWGVMLAISVVIFLWFKRKKFM
ncbi:CorA family divalent cation transporter [Algoriphagus terrigena]|uniref:CorA family divalent cation transporter n=1 Tax=Algoriphagus terrigena TaxID=344884 RepID=UPI00041C4F84|nr:CorA family divalent cation transporter [Algoriphagus terrigena]